MTRPADIAECITRLEDHVERERRRLRGLGMPDSDVIRWVAQVLEYVVEVEQAEGLQRARADANARSVRALYK